MPKVNLVHTNFTAGELTPKMWGRVDVARYISGAKVILNGWPQVHGGVQKRWGTLFTVATKNADKRARLVPFVFSRTQAYMLEFGDGYMRVHTDAGVILVDIGDGMFAPYEIETPYTEAMLGAMDFTQAADTMILWHAGKYPRRLRRFADDKWKLDLAPFNPAPFDEIGHRPAATITLSDITVGTGRTATASAAAFLPADVGRQIWAGTGTANITGYTSSTEVTVTVLDEFDVTAYPLNEWQLTGSPQATLNPSITGPVGDTITLTLGASSVEGEKNISSLSWTAGIVEVGVNAHGYSTGNAVIVSLVTPAAYNGTRTITVIDPSTFSYPLTADPGAAMALGKVARVNTSSSAGWRPEDVGKLVRVNTGLVRITSYTSASQVQGIVLEELNTTVGAVANAWILNGSVWNDVDGYPATGTFHMQRLCAAGSPRFPQRVWGSGIGEFFGFQLGTEDDEAFAYDIVSDDMSPISYLSSMDALVALSYGVEFTMEGGVEKPITPTNIKAKPRSNNGCELVRPVRVGEEEMFVQRAGKAIRALSYESDTGKWACPDITVLADHLMQAGIVSLAWHRNPTTLLMAARADGLVNTCTFDRDQDVAGWARQDFGGVVESVATIPNGGADRTWLIVRRVIDGQTVRYIEKLDDSTYTDCAIKGTSEEGDKVWTGLEHLEGMEVSIRADGVPQPRRTVEGGQITLQREAKAVEIGLPFSLRIDLLDPEVGGSGGAAQGNPMRTHKVTVRLLETVGLKVNGQIVEFRKFGKNVLDNPIAPYTGLVPIENLGWEDGESDLVIEHDDPLPCTVLSVIRRFTWNEG